MPKYVEINRTVESKNECILFVYLRDANGTPVPGVKFKIWGGPPPVGDPPYFVDDNPNNPNRWTDSTGRFQFILGGPPANRTDFWVQPLDASGSPQSDPIQFTFLARQTVWISVILSPEGSTAPPGTIPPVPELQLDPRLDSVVGVSVQLAQTTVGQLYWKLISAQYQNENESGGNVNIVCCVQNEFGQPALSQSVVQTWPDGQAAQLTDGFGVIRFPMSGDSSFAPDRGEHGPYSAFVAGLPSDRVVGMGLPLRRHVQYLLTWRKVTAAEPTPDASSRVSGTIRNAPTSLELTLASDERTLTTNTNAAGYYEFADLPAGVYALTIAGIGVVNPSLVLDGANAITFDYEIEPPQPPAPGKTLTHYLLFGSPNLSATRTNLILALDYVAQFGPTVGFSVNEAKTASNVTIVGAGAISAADEQALQGAGCTVRHIAGADSYAVEQLFAQLIASQNPYPSG